MKDFARRPLIIVCSLVMAAICGVGCSSYPPNLNVSLDSAAVAQKSQNVEVHLLAVSDEKFLAMQKMSVTQYWQPGGEGRGQVHNESCRIIQLSSEQPSVTIAKGDPIWEKWNDPGLTHLMVLADLSNAPDRDTPADPRRGTMALDRKRLKYAKTVTITISRAGIHIEPTPRAKDLGD